MPELPDIELYAASLRKHVVGKAFTEFKLFNPFVLRTVSPRPGDLLGVPIVSISRIGKRLALEFEDGRFMVIHLMVSGRFRWILPTAKAQPKITHVAWRFEDGQLILTEASSKKRAGVWLFANGEAAMSLDPGGIDPLTVGSEEFFAQITQENRTVKRALTNPRWFSGIGNAYSDEILHTAKMSPLKLTKSLTEAEAESLRLAMVETLTTWRDRLLAEFNGGAKFPGQGQVTAFRPDFAVHGKFNQPCPVCGKPVQHIVYADNETNYCAVCQNGGRILADRSMSRLLKEDWPRSFDEDEA